MTEIMKHGGSLRRCTASSLAVATELSDRPFLASEAHELGERAQRSAKNVAGRPGARLFGDDVTWPKLASMIAAGAEIRRDRVVLGVGLTDRLLVDPGAVANSSTDQLVHRDW